MTAAEHAIENALNMIQWRSNHKLDEWNVFCDELLKLPYMKDFVEAMN